MMSKGCYRSPPPVSKRISAWPAEQGSRHKKAKPLPGCAADKGISEVVLTAAAIYGRVKEGWPKGARPQSSKEGEEILWPDTTQREFEYKERIVAINRVSKTVRADGFSSLLWWWSVTATAPWATVSAKRARCRTLSAKGIEDAKKHLIPSSLKGTTIPHEIIGKFGAGRNAHEAPPLRYRRYCGRRCPRRCGSGRHQGYPHQGSPFQQSLQRGQRDLRRSVPAAYGGRRRQPSAASPPRNLRLTAVRGVLAADPGASFTGFLSERNGFAMAKKANTNALQIKLVRSLIGAKPDQVATAASLGSAQNWRYHESAG